MKMERMVEPPAPRGCLILFPARYFGSDQGISTGDQRSVNGSGLNNHLLSLRKPSTYGFPRISQIVMGNLIAMLPRYHELSKYLAVFLLQQMIQHPRKHAR